ncbi:uncharacterized protein LOC130688451 [Daphnia carinata]|uniref:uncharacterized protein LOC130688451 n=1 Tax=Daphnia carinata TaxID=120202 RepID=UPI00257C98B5|nr:uncharacterized protein LOC130688451 [Daphnia carinata]
MKLALILLALVVMSHQQFQYRTNKPRGLFWLSPYSPQRVITNYHPTQLYNDYYLQNEIPYPIHSRPSTRIGVTYVKDEEVNPDVIISSAESQNNDEEDFESLDIQSRIKLYQQQQNGGRFFGSSTINNPFIKTATFTISSTVTTVGSIVTCVPANNLAAVPAPTCNGRKRRSDDDENEQFPIVPTETLSLVPTAVTRESRQLSNILHEGAVTSSKEEFSPAELSEKNSREKRFFGSGVAAVKTVTSYSFVGATLTNTVILDPTGMNVAVCLPAGYVVCG